MATPQERMRDWLLAQVGYVADGYKRTKYGEMLDSIGFYNGPKNGYDWCDQFYDAGLVENFGEQKTYDMTGQFKGSGGAGCWLSAGYYRDIGRWSDEPSIGAQIFFGEYGDESHTGGVVAFDATTVTTVEGNTDYSLGYSTGRVGKHTWSRWDSRIVGYGIPKWSLVAGGWVRGTGANSDRWWWRNADGSYPAAKWLEVDGKWYHFDAEGWMDTGWVHSGDKWYYCNEGKGSTEGMMLASTCVEVDGHWYVLGADGAMLTGSIATNDVHDGTFGAVVFE